MVSIIVATDNKGGIGKDNQLLWHLPNDLKRFKFLTNNHTIVMGRKTFESIGRALPNRKNVIVSRNIDLIIENCEVYHSLESAMNAHALEDVFIIGGAEIYKQALTLADKIYLTKVDTELEADAYFPSINEAEWELVKFEKQEKDEKHLYEYAYLDYVRRKN